MASFINPQGNDFCSTVLFVVYCLLILLLFISECKKNVIVSQNRREINYRRVIPVLTYFPVYFKNSGAFLTQDSFSPKWHLKSLDSKKVRCTNFQEESIIS